MNELNYIIKDILDDLKKVLDNAGIYYRIFARQKANSSIKKKLNIKADKYRKNGEKMQDIIGIRIVFYFMDDIEIINEYFHLLPTFVDESNSHEDIKKVNERLKEFGDLNDKIFMPTRLNLILRMDERHTEELQKELSNVDINEFDVALIDNTYEIQLRTVLSEGWHEVEHDLRYKTLKESWWQYCDAESRMLNGIYATLETSERAMSHIFSDIAYKNYRNKEWAAMLRNHLRLHTLDLELSQNIVNVLNENIELAKCIFRIDRKNVIGKLLNFGIAYPLKMDNLVFLINRLLQNPSKKLKDLENGIIKGLLDKKIGGNTL